MSGLRPHQLELLQRTVAKDCSRAEFDLFIEAAENYGLDPFRRQIMPLVLAKDYPERRRTVIIVGIDGQRVMAQRCGNYRPASEPTTFVYNKGRRGATNPLGLVLARVKCGSRIIAANGSRSLVMLVGTNSPRSGTSGPKIPRPIFA